MRSTNPETTTKESLQVTASPLATPGGFPVERHRLKQILVPVDFSPPSEVALHHALLFAEHSGAKINLLHVIEPRRYNESEELADWHNDFDEITRATRRRLELMVERMIPPSSMGTVQSRIGKPFEQITAAAKETDSDLIAIASHGYTGLQYVLIGSTAEHIARDAPLPVLVVRRRVEGVLAPSAIARLEKVLVPIDFSPASLRALDYALWITRPFGAKVTVLHVVEPPGLSSWLGGVEPPRLEAKLKEIALDSIDIDRVKKQLRTGVPLDEILTTADSGGFDLMVLSTRGRIGISGHLLGSTAERLLRHATCPVLIAREMDEVPNSATSTPG